MRKEKSKPTEKLYDAITEIDDEYVEKAENYDLTPQKFTFKKRHLAWIATAACLCLIVGTVVSIFLGGRSGGGGAHEYGSAYMSYTGPIFPLTSTSDVTGIEVTRHTDWDFSPYESEIHTIELHPDIPSNTETYTFDRYETESIVSEKYVLTNITEEDITLSLLYPFAARFSDKIQAVPQISVNGESANVTFFSGKYCGSYAPVWGDEDSDEQVNLHEPSYWTDFKTLLTDGVYLADSMKEFPSLDIPIIVYEYSNLTYTGNEKPTNPTFSVHYKHDSTKTTISGWGWNAGGWEDDGTGYYACSRVYVPDGNAIDKGATAYFIVIGEDIETPTVTGYINAGCDDGNELEGVTADFKKYETTMEQFLLDICLADYVENMEYMVGTDYSDETYIQSLLTQEMLLGHIAQLMYDSGILSNNVIERYDTGWLEDYVYEFNHLQRVMYLSFDVTIPAESSITVDATMTKDASIDFIGKNKDRNGYDIVTTLASPFTFTKQTASVSNYDSIEILDQNFGFDLENGITEVELNLNEEHYWMDIKKISDTE
ncbi:MAG: hypothetical protein IJ958_08910 [Agathobacter sp.]|nr:hypothetical protein [Agathobacter sp.]